MGLSDVIAHYIVIHVVIIERTALMMASRHVMICGDASWGRS
jgi:hypothetical protein